MVNKNKVKGTRWENDFVKLIEEDIEGAEAKRIPASGAIGSSLNEPLLEGDVIVKIPGLNKKFRIECKTGYGGESQLTLQRKWLNKIREEAEHTFSYPALAGKFLGARAVSGVQYFIVLDYDAFVDIMNYIGKVNG